MNLGYWRLIFLIFKKYLIIIWIIIGGLRRLQNHLRLKQHSTGPISFFEEHLLFLLLLHNSELLSKKSIKELILLSIIMMNLIIQFDKSLFIVNLIRMGNHLLLLLSNNLLSHFLIELFCSAYLIRMLLSINLALNIIHLKLLLLAC